MQKVEGSSPFIRSEESPGNRGFLFSRGLSLVELAWLSLHGAVLRATEPSLNRGQGVPDELVERLIEVPGG